MFEPADLNSGQARPTATNRQDVQRQSAAASAALLIGSGLSSVAVEIGATIVLARLLMPEDFGLLAMASVFLAMVNKLQGFGFSTATVQRETLDEATLTRLFWINGLINLAVTTLIVMAAPLLAAFYGEPRLRLVVWVLAAAWFIGSLASIHDGLIRRSFRFGTVTLVAGVSTLVATAAAVAAAWLGAGYWALVLQIGLKQVVQAVGLFALAGWCPGGPRRAQGAAESDTAVQQMLGHGGNVSASNVIAYFGRNLDFILVGAIAGAGQLGLYHKAYRLAALPFQQIYLPTMNVALAKFSRQQRQPEQYRASLRRAILALSGLIVPLMAYAAVEAEPLILLLGEQWQPAVPLFRLLLIGTFCNGLLLILKWMYQSEGRTRSLLRWTLVSSPVMAAGIAVGSIWGVTGIAVGFDIATALLVPPAYVVFCRGSVLRERDFVSPLIPSLLAAGVGAAATAAAIAAIEPGGTALRLPVGVTIMFASYAAAFALLPGGRGRVADLWQLAKPLWKRRAT